MRRLRVMACRLGLHFMVYDFPCDRYECACRYQTLRMEDIWRAGGFGRHGWYFEHHRQEWRHYADNVLVETLPADARPAETARMRRAAADGVL